MVSSKTAVDVLFVSHFIFFYHILVTITGTQDTE